MSDLGTLLRLLDSAGFLTHRVMRFEILGLPGFGVWHVAVWPFGFGQASCLVVQGV